MTDVHVEGTLASPNAPSVVVGTFVAKARGADFSLETIRPGNQTSYRVLRDSGSLHSGGQTRPLPPYNTTGLALDILPLFARWTEFIQGNATISPAEQVTLDGVRCLLIHVDSGGPPQDVFHRNDHAKAEVFIDAMTGLVAAIRYRATLGPDSGDHVEVANRFADYRNFSGILLPMRITRYILGRPTIVLRVQAIQFNNGFTDRDFQN